MMDVTNIIFEIKKDKKLKLRRLALEENTSLSEIMRRLVNGYLSGKIKLI